MTVVGPCIKATKIAGIIAIEGPKFGIKLSIPAIIATTVTREFNDC